MIEENKAKSKMTATDAIVRMIVSINSGNEADFYKVTSEFADTLAFGGSSRGKVVQALRQKPQRLKQLDEMSLDIKKLLIQSPNEDENVFLTDSVNEVIETLLLEWKHTDVYRYHNINPRTRILLYGPTGNGKTTIARYIARKSRLPFIEVNSDIIIDSHIGSTSTNIHKVLNSISQPCILFWDEVDSIGCKRGDGRTAASQENDRMVNSILVNLQKLNRDVIFIGATNRMEILDSAFLRRFDLKIEIPAPSGEDMVMFVQQLMDYHRLVGVLPLPFNAMKGISSFSDAHLKVTELARQHLLNTIKNNQ